MTNEPTADPTSATPPRKRSLGARLKWPVIALIGLLALYVASPYYSFWRFTEALKAGDQKQFESRVDFRAVRESLKKQLKAKLAEGKAKDAPKDPNEPKKENALFTLSEQFAPRLIDTLVDAYVTPAGLAALLADAKNVNAARAAAGNAGAAPNPGAVVQPQEVRDKLGFRSVRYAFFTGARDFMIDVDGTKLRFRFSKFRWTLKAIEPELDEIRF